MSSLDWSQCPAVESIPGKRSGAWVFKGTRTPISTVFENIEDMSVDELVEEFGVTREQVHAVLDFAAQSAESAGTQAVSRGEKPLGQATRSTRNQFSVSSPI